jgi:hypothetical protein
MNGNSSASPKEASATGRPDRDPLAAQDDRARFLTQDKIVANTTSSSGAVLLNPS